TLTIRPARCRFITGRTAREATKTLVRFERRIDSHSASVMSSVARIVAKPPALLTSTSTRCQRSTTASTTPRTSPGAAASARNPTASAPVSRKRLAVASAPAPSRSSTARRAPSRAKASAVTAPIPRAARVAVHYYANEGAAKDTLERVRKHGADGFLVQADVSRVDDVRRMFGEVKQRFGTLDVFVANARPEAAKFYQKPMEITLEAWDHAMDSQAKAFLVGVREAAGLMGQGGRIVAITYAPGGQRGTWQPWVAMG